MRIIIAFILSIFLVSTAWAQPIGNSTYDQKLESADIAIENKDYYNALELYEEAYKESKDPQLALAIADLSSVLRDYKKAERYYGRLLKRDKNGDYLTLRYDFAQALKAQGKYQEAYDEFRVFISETDEEDKKALAIMELKGIEMKSSFEENIAVVVSFAGKEINKGQSEYSPAIAEDGSLYYGSFDENKKIEVEENGDYKEAGIYFSSVNDKGKYNKPGALGEHINRPGFHTSNVSFSRDGKTMYFTRAVLQGNSLSESKIYQSFQSDGNWTAAEEVNGVNGDYIATHPKMGELYGSEVMFFSSTMDGGYGGYDIYYATKTGENEFSTPVNLGKAINTAVDEITPYYNDGTLYFSSNGHPGLGGQDIFYTGWDGANWGEITNMGFNYNTSYDEQYYYMDASGIKGFLTSNRPAKGKRSLNGKTCCDDIYGFEIRQVVVDLLATVEDKEGPLKGAAIELMDISAPEEIDTQIKTNEDDNKFNFLLDGDHEYRAIISKAEYHPDTIYFNTLGILDDYTVKKKIILEAKPPVVAEPEVEIVSINQAIRLNNIYYDFDDDKILMDAEKDLGVLLGLLNEYPDMVIELSSHTDSQGVSTYNKKLSQRRADSAKRWLLEKGIADARINAVGYGEGVILNECKNGVRCTDDQHRVNRRTEFKIIAGPETIEIKREIISTEKKN